MKKNYTTVLTLLLFVFTLNIIAAGTLGNSENFYDNNYKNADSYNTGFFDIDSNLNAIDLKSELIIDSYSNLMEAFDVSCPSDILTNSDLGTCGAVVNYTMPTTDDPVNNYISISVSSSAYESGNTFPVGTTNVVYEERRLSDDFVLNTCDFNVTVTDNENPTVLCNNFDVYLDPSGNGSITIADINNGSTDNCGLSSTVAPTLSQYDFDCSDAGSTVNVTLTFTDVNSNVGSCVSAVTIHDNIAPNIKLPSVDASYDTDNNECVRELSFTATATGICNNTIITYSVGGSLIAFPYDFPVGTTNVVVFADDGNGQTDTDDFDVVVVDNESPIITLNGPATITLEACSDTYNEQGATATDNCSVGAVTIGGDVVNDNVPGTYTVTYNINDVNNVAAVEVTRTVTIQDTTPPVIALTGNSTITLEACTDTYNEQGATATDNCSVGAVTIGGDVVDDNVPGIYTVTYNVNDVNNVAAVEVTRTVTIQDTTPPVIALTGNSTITLEACTDTYNEQGATAIDNCSVGAVTISGDVVDDNVPGIYTVTYNVNDVNNVAAVEVTRTVTIQDTTPPVITLTGSNTITLEACTDIYNEQGATASDNCSVGAVTIGGDVVDDNVPGTYTVTYNVTDVNSLAAAQVTRTVTVQDNTPPNAVCQDITIQLDSSGNVSITPAQIDNNSSDNCGIQSMTLSKTSFDCTDLDDDFSTTSVIIPVTLTVTDTNNLQDSCEVNVTLLKPETVNNSSVDIQINQGSTTLCAIPEETLELQAITNNIGSDVSYIWLKNGNPVTDDNMADDIYETTGDNISNGDIFTVETTSTINNCVRILESTDIVMTTNAAKPVSFTFNSAPTEVCEEDDITFSVNPSAIVNGGASSASPPIYQWFIDEAPIDGNFVAISGAINSSYNIDTANNSLATGSHVIRLEVSSNVLCASPVPAFQEATFTVNPLPEDIVTEQGEVCANQQTTEDLTSLVTAFSASTDTFYENDTDANSDSSAISSTVDTAGSYWVRREFGTGCYKVASITVIENALPTIGITATVNGSPVTITNDKFEVCSGADVVLIGDGDNSNLWDNGITNNTIFQATTTTTYTVTGTDNAGCSNTNSVTVTVNPLLVPAVTISGPTDICLGDPNTAFLVETTDNSGSSPTYEWFRTNGGSPISLGNGSNFSTDQLSDGEGIYAVMTPSSEICLTQPSAQSNTINVNGYTAITDITTALADNAVGNNNITNICPVENGLVYTLGADDTNVQTYNWTVPNGFEIVSGGDTHQITVNALSNAVPGNITVTTVNPCGNSSSTLTIEMDSFGAVNAGPDRYVCVGTSQVQLSGSTTGVIDKANEFDWVSSTGGNPFNWNGNNYNNKLNATFTIPNNANAGDIITITIEASNRVSNTCNSEDIEDTMTIYIIDSNILTINTNSPVCNDGDGEFDVSIIGSIPSTDIEIEYNINGVNPQTLNVTTDGSGDATSTLVTNGLSGLTFGSDPTINLTSLTYPDGTTCSVSGVNQDIIVNEAAEVTVSADMNVICSSGTAIATASLGGSANSGTWTIDINGDGNPDVDDSDFDDNTSLNPTYTPGSAAIAEGQVELIFTTDDPDGTGPCLPVSHSAIITITPTPFIENAGPDLEACETESPAPLNLTGVILGGGVTNGVWSIVSSTPDQADKGSLNNSNDINTATYTPPANFEGTITLELTVNNIGNCPDVLTQQRTITILPEPELQVMDDTAACFDLASGNNTVSLSIIAMANVSSGTWTSSGSGSFSPNANDPDATYNLTGADNTNGAVTLTFTTNNAVTPCNDISDDVVITVNEIINITSQPENTPACVGNNASFSIDAIGDIVSYEWYKGDAADGPGDDTALSTDSNVLNFTPTTLTDNGSYYVILTAADGCTSVTSTEVTLNVNETITIVDQPDSAIVCERDNNNSIDFTIVGDGSISGFDMFKVGNPTALQSQAGTYNASTTHTTAVFTLSDIALSDAGDYFIAVNGFSNACPDLQSDTVTLTVTENPDPTFVFGSEFCSNDGNQLPSGVINTGGVFSATPVSSSTSTSSPLNIANGWLNTTTGEVDLTLIPQNDFKIWYSFADGGDGGCAFVEYSQSIQVDTFVNLSQVSVHGTSNVGTPTTGNGIAVCYDNSNIQLDIVGDYGTSQIIRWERFDPSVSSDINDDNAWQDISTISETIDTGTLNDSQAFRVVFDSGNCGIQYSEPAFVDVVTTEDLEPQPVSASPTEFCINETSRLSSSINYGGEVLNQDGGFDQGQLNTTDPDGWLVDGELGKLSASGNSDAKPNNWSTTNDGKTYYGKLYDNDNPSPYEDRKKFGITSGYYNTTGTGDKHPIIYNSFNNIFSDPADQAAYNDLYMDSGVNMNNIRITTMETPIFNLTGVDDANFEFFEAYSLTGAQASCETDENSGSYQPAPPAASIIEISTDGGITYTPIPDSYYNNPPDADNPPSRINRTSSIVVGPSDTGTASFQDFNTVSIDLDAYRLYSDLRIRFTYVRNCSSAIAIEGISLPGLTGAALTEWRDQYNNTSTILPITGSNDVTYQPGLPGYQHVNVRSIIAGCENPNSLQEVPLTVYNAYAGNDVAAVLGDCGGIVALHAYDNRRTPLQNYVKMNELNVWDGTAFSIMDFDGQNGWDIATQDDIDENGVNGKYTFTTHPGGGGLPAADYRDFGPTNAIQYWTVNGERRPEWFAPTTPEAIGEEDAYANFIGPEGTHTLVWNVESPDNGNISCSGEIIVSINNCSTLDWDHTTDVNDHVDFGNEFNFNGAFSIELWALAEKQNTVILSKMSTSDNSGYILELEGPNPKFTMFNNGNSKSVKATGSITGQTKDIWNHIAVTYDGATLSIYVNGIFEDDDSSATNALGSNTSKFILGAQDDGAGFAANFYEGWMDELKIWNKALSLNQIREMMNQEIIDSGGVRGVITQQLVNGLSWADLMGYYQMNVINWDHTADCTNNPTVGNDVVNGYLQDNSGTGINGRLRYIDTEQDESAPLPYTTTQNGDWNSVNTWTYGTSVWNIPNSKFQGKDLDWNIVVLCDNVVANGKIRSNPEETNIDYVVLGLVSLNGELTVTDAGGAQNENNPGNGLWVTHYLKLDGSIDLIGESQLIQKRYNSTQFGDSELDPTSSGFLERDQQGQTNLYNYNYFSSPVGPIGTGSINGNYSVGGVLMDATDTNNLLNIGWISDSYDAGATTDPIKNSDRWIFKFNNKLFNQYLQWEYLSTGGGIEAGIGFTLKGSGVGTAMDGQNYAFKGLPFNGTITLPLIDGRQSMVGNPYASAIDANEFINNNLPGNTGSTSGITGELYFWRHFSGNNTHILRDYQGGYTIKNLTGSLETYIPIEGIGTETLDGFFVSGIEDFGSTTRPGDYIPVGQGFFVTASGSGSTVEFRNNQRYFVREEGSSATSTFTRIRNNYQTVNNDDTSAINRIRIDAMLPQKVLRPLLIGFIDNGKATDDYDMGYDAESKDNSAPDDVFWNIENNDYPIQGVGEFDVTKKYPLSVYSAEGGTFKFKVREFENFEEEIEVFVYDSLLDTYTLINSEPFEVTLDNTFESRERFFITFQSDEALEIDEEIEKEIIENLTVNYLNDSQEILVKSPADLKVKQIYLINIVGQTLKSWNATNTTLSSEMRIPVSRIADGNYIIKLETDKGSFNKKVVIKQ